MEKKPNRNKKIKLLLVISLFLGIIYSFEVYSQLTCQVTSGACSGSESTIFKMSSTANAHAEQPSEANYDISVCCQIPGVDFGNVCGNPDSVTVLKLSGPMFGTTNAHVEKNTFSNYLGEVCMSSLDTNLVCNYKTAACESYETCVATISSDTNAHVADCAISPYSTRICCYCEETLAGNIVDEDGNLLENVNIDVRDSGLNLVAQTLTDANGDYSVDVPCGTYNIIATLADYVPKTISKVIDPLEDPVVLDFELVYGLICEDDCTYTGDNIVHAGCEGINGCLFCITEPTTAALCDNAQPGWIREFDANREVVCAEGCPQAKTTETALVTCDEENLIKVTKVVTYKGQLVKLVVVTCG
jgi:hypothetical protein